VECRCRTGQIRPTIISLRSPVQYLAYGSNLHPVRLQRRVPSAVLLGVARLEGWELTFHKRGQDGSGKCTIHRVTSSETSVHAAIFQLDPTEKPALDRVEGAGYDVETLTVPHFGEVFTYRAAPGHLDPALRPFSWYHQLVLAGCSFHKFPEPYRRALHAVSVREDPDTARHRCHLKILDTCAESSPLGSGSSAPAMGGEELPRPGPNGSRRTPPRS